jgi:hypothetical protein
MTLLFALDTLSLLAALCTALYTVFIMIKWPPGRDPRPMAPLLALALAFIVLKMHPYMGWEDAYGKLRDYAWRGWYIVAFIEFILLIRLFGRRRDGCGVGAASAVIKKGRK